MDLIITRKLRDLEGYIQQLRKFQSYSYNEIKDNLEKIWAIEHGLQISIQTIIDIGNHILAMIGENQIEEYVDILDKLSKHNVLPPRFVADIRGMVGFRNILVHRYGEVNPQQVYDVLQNELDDFEKYIGYIQSYFSSKQ